MLSRFLPVIRAIGPDQSLEGDLLKALSLGREGRISCAFAPFDHIPPTARLAVVGITPGRVQAENALRTAGEALRLGKPVSEVMRIAKLTASFSGSQTRNNLVAMLDAIGLGSRLGLRSSADLFDLAGEVVHFTSALRYPVFVDGQNYRGSPPMTRSPLLRRMIETHLAEEVAALPAALWLPLGPVPAEGLLHLVKIGILSKERVLVGMPHPSGLNGERVSAFLGKIEDGQGSAKTNVAKLLAARARLAQQIMSL